ncbi:hypothetical protein JCM21714_3695 [Gracilibacillus boraciitolerans JCM 21714]|uniref:Barwin domain-containing protein n=1 Tax=Gracilibacillus boraciitolerans JCM 21714 TaxID=1298598 RepID=W4VNW8_9BACI|nr:DUF3889 domain-containing protein [Gracilibacillus boraciitolerans]GAE94533.1 hypothetical protein JCM21714_3695 [Gracilibacillus boraciitolerans JCM 21714]
MYSNYGYGYPFQTYYPYPIFQPQDAYQDWQRQNYIKGQATWTEGGTTTQCNIPWSYYQYMTAAVSSNSPYQCGQTLKVKNPQNAREIIVTVVDSVPNVSATNINLHRKAFEALGANPAIGVLAIEFQPSPELEQVKWGGKYLLEVTQIAYPNYHVTDYLFVEKTQPTSNKIKEIYDYTLQSQQERIKVRGTVVYNPTTERVISFDIKEL